MQMFMPTQFDNGMMNGGGFEPARWLQPLAPPQVHINACLPPPAFTSTHGPHFTQPRASEAPNQHRISGRCSEK